MIAPAGLPIVPGNNARSDAPVEGRPGQGFAAMMDAVRVPVASLNPAMPDPEPLDPPADPAADPDGSAGAVPARPVMAERFNEHGFFGRTGAAVILGVPAEPALPAEPTLPASSDAVPTESSASPLPGPTRDAPMPVLDVPPHAPFAAAASPSAVPACKAAIVGTGPVMPSTPSPDAPLPRLARASSEVESAPQATARARNPERGASLSSSVAIAVHEVQQGLAVAVGIGADRIDDGDRAALTDEVAALLSRHGFAPHRIVVVGGAVPRPPRRQR